MVFLGDEMCAVVGHGGLRVLLAVLRSGSASFGKLTLHENLLLKLLEVNQKG